MASTVTEVASSRPAPPERLRPERQSHDRNSWRETVAVWVGRLLLIAAVWSLITIPLRGSVVAEFGADLLGLFNIPGDPSFFMAGFLAVLAGGVRRRLRAAYIWLVVLSAISVAASVAMVVRSQNHPEFIDDLRLRGLAHDYAVFRTGTVASVIGLVIGVTAFAILLSCRKQFPARLSKNAVGAALGVLAGGLFFSFAVTFLLTLQFHGSLHTVGEKLLWSLRSTFGIDSNPANSAILNGHSGLPWVYGLAGVLSALALLLSLLVFYRSGRQAEAITADEELLVRRLLLEYGEDDSLGYFATRRDKSVLFSHDGLAAVTFRNEGSVSLASADPIGRHDSWADAVDLWIKQCRDTGRYPAVLSSSERGTLTYKAAGLRTFPLGDEAIISVERFNLNGPTMSPVRQAVRRVDRAGYTTQVRRHSELSPDELALIAKLAEEWRGEDTERGFSMALNRLGDPADGRCLIITAHDTTGTIRGFLSFVPWGSRGVSLDLMRRDRTAENGLNEYMVSCLVDAAPKHGIRRISLNFAVFREVFSNADQVSAGPVTKVTDAALSYASKFFQLETLYRSNDKYQPDWVPRLLCYDPALTVARAGLAMGTAEGFVPVLGPRFLVGQRLASEQEQRADPGFVTKVREQEHELLAARAPEPVLNEQQRVRRDKMAISETEGLQPYPVSVPRTHRVADLLERYVDLPADQVTDETVSVAGRLRAVRDFGGVVFAVLDDEAARIQVMVTRDGTPDQARCSWRSATDLGDLVSVTGRIATSRTGELSVLMDSWQLAAKCLSPIPTLGTTLSDEVRARNRTLELLSDPAAMDVLRKRSIGVRSIRKTLQDGDFHEVETPILQTVHGGANARPFTTHINAYDMDLYLRIAPELFLKRLAVGGMQRVFELGRNFRNEGVDATHNPEFTSLEAYQAYADYNVMRELAREVIINAAIAIHGSPVAARKRDDGTVDLVDLSAPWPVKTVYGAVSEAVGVELTTATPRDEIAAVCRDKGLELDDRMTAGQLIAQLYDDFVEGQTTFPTFYTDFPVETSPLTRVHRTDPKLSERWDLVAWGAELGTAYSELIDPIDQRRRLTQQSLAAAAGDLEAMEVDEDFLRSLELGLPPTGGLGLGVDRVIMMIVGEQIKATLAFPFVKPHTING